MIECNYPAENRGQLHSLSGGPHQRHQWLLVSRGPEAGRVTEAPSVTSVTGTAGEDRRRITLRWSGRGADCGGGQAETTGRAGDGGDNGDGAGTAGRRVRRGDRKGVG